MIKAAIATAAFITCCLGNPADAAPNRNVNRNTNRNVQRQTQRQTQRQVNRQSLDAFNFQALTVNEGDEATQHAPIPAPPTPASPDSIAVLSIYGQVDQAGPVAGFAVSIPLQ